MISSRFSRATLALTAFCLAAFIPSQAQNPPNGPSPSHPALVATLHPTLAWQRTSPARGQMEGPVLYQLLFSTAGTPGALAKFDTNPRHLTNSLISEDSAGIHIGGLAIASTGAITLCCGQSFGAGGTVTNVASGLGLTGGPITTSGALSLDTNFTNNLYSRLAAANTFTRGTQAIQTGRGDTVGLVVQGAKSQIANLQEWRDIAGTAVASVSASGVFSGNGSGLSSLSGSQLVDGGINREQIALLKWYPANQTTSFPDSSGPMGRTQPFGVAFDGANIWVTNQNGDNVIKLQASDGAPLGTFAVGSGPTGVAFDGANIWVANSGTPFVPDNTVSKLLAIDGSPQGTFTVGTNPQGVAFDGANIWVTNFNDNTVSKLASNGTLLGTFAVGSGPRGVAFDGANIWVANSGTPLVPGNTVSKLASNGTLLGTFAVGSRPAGVAFDGANIWVVNEGSNTVSKLRASDGTLLGTFAVGASPRGVAFDGANIWVTNRSSNTVSKL